MSAPEKRDCSTCLNRCMDMDLDPYCAADEVLKKHPFGLALYRGVPAECLKEGVRTLWQEDSRRR